MHEDTFKSRRLARVGRRGNVCDCAERSIGVALVDVREADLARQCQAYGCV